MVSTSSMITCETWLKNTFPFNNTNNTNKSSFQFKMTATVVNHLCFVLQQSSRRRHHDVHQTIQLHISPSPQQSQPSQRQQAEEFTDFFWISYCSPPNTVVEETLQK
jgi:hypothetical protein